MRLRFRVHYHTSWGQTLCVCGSPEQLGAWDAEAARPMNYLADGFWELSIDLPDDSGDMSYKYFVRHEYGGGTEWEFGPDRILPLPTTSPEELVIQDNWRAQKAATNALYSSLFQDVLLKRPASRPSRKSRPEGKFVHRFQIYAPDVQPEEAIGIIGNDQALGAWKPAKLVRLDDRNFPLWSVEVELAEPLSPVEYKFVKLNRKTRKISSWEDGHNRYLSPEYGTAKSRYLSITAESFRQNQLPWRGTGVAIPVFSLRSNNGMGIGEFTDLKLMIDWAAETNMSMVQILPVNDTVATHTWTDSYPYAAISVFALHPIYANLPAMGRLKSEKERTWFESQQNQLNQLPEVDYEAVMLVKSRYFSLLFQQDWSKTAKSAAYKTFFNENQDWLVPYASFCALRDKFGTVKFEEWPEFSEYNQEAIEAFTDASADHFNDVAIHYFIQFHLDKQLKEAKAYAESLKIGIKGDIPIGIYRHSVDAWVAPHLYNMNGQAGAPPDAFATAGQNWGFPTYDWNEMAKDGFAWWRKRLTQLSGYFDSFRIDHILGFFRIWEVPYDQIQGILGQFNAALPFYRDELAQRGIWLDEDRMTRPYIREHFLSEFFGEWTESVKREFLTERSHEPGRYDFKPEFDTQRKISEFIERQTTQYPESKEFYEGIREGLYGLIAQVIFLPYPGSDGHGWSPRIAMHFTKSFQELDGGTKAVLDELYVDFFYHRHESFWRDQAMMKLPAIKDATNMLVCGEDLGMVPECVPGVMDELGILSLEIQRMPKASEKEFDHPADAPYLSVISTSTHDMPTVRGWWEEDREATQRFFNHILGHHGGAPFFCESWVANDIIQQHLYSPAMWAIIPFQDFLAIDDELRRQDPAEEQINVPANPTHYWRYRMHLTLEELLKEESFNRRLGKMISDSGRR